MLHHNIHAAEEFIAMLILGPCSLESKEQILPIIDLCNKWGVRYVRAQAFKPRTHPSSFQGLGEKAFPLFDLFKKNNLRLVSEVLSREHLEILAPHIDVIQIGARNMQNFELLKDIGRHAIVKERGTEVLLKRGFQSTLYEWEASAQYLIDYGIPREDIIMCERGTRHGLSKEGVVLDLPMALAMRAKGHRVIVDPSHGTKNSAYVLPMAQAILALELDGLMIEVHPFPRESVSDAQQALGIDEVDEFLEGLNRDGKLVQLREGKEEYARLDADYTRQDFGKSRGDEVSVTH